MDEKLTTGQIVVLSVMGSFVIMTAVGIGTYLGVGASLITFGILGFIGTAIAIVNW